MTSVTQKAMLDRLKASQAANKAVASKGLPPGSIQPPPGWSGANPQDHGPQPSFGAINPPQPVPINLPKPAGPAPLVNPYQGGRISGGPLPGPVMTPPNLATPVPAPGPATAGVNAGELGTPWSKLFG